MIKFITRILFTFIVLILFYSVAYSQTNTIVIDQFTDHTLSGWVSGGNISMKYSHKTDNAENGYGIVNIGESVTPNAYAGIIRKEQKIQFAQDNILSVMLQGTSNDMNAVISILFDNNNDGKYDESLDTRLETKSISLNFSGWKELHFNISDKDLKLISKNKSEDMSILEEEAIGFQVSYQTGKDYKAGKLETGIALISERPNKEVKQETAGSETNGESYFGLKNYPNPFNPETTINYTLNSSTNVKITVYDRLGREVTVLQDGVQSEGEHSVIFNASSLPSGVYFYRVKTNEKVEVRKMVLAK